MIGAAGTKTAGEIEREDGTAAARRAMARRPALRRSRALMTGAVALLVGWATVMAASAPAWAAFGIVDFSGKVTANAAGDPLRQAGAHPYDASTTIEFNRVVNPSPLLGTLPDEQVKTIQVDLPPGFVGNPTATPKCTEDQLARVVATNGQSCPAASQVGLVTVLQGGPTVHPADPLPVYNMATPEGVPGMFGFNAANTVIHLMASVRSGSDYGLTITVDDVSQAIPLIGVTLTFWGVPADSSHDDARGTCAFTDVDNDGDATNDDRCPAGVSPSPFLTNPTDCAAGLLTTRLRVDSWDHPGDFKTASFDHDSDGVAMEVDHCERLPFAPTISVQPDSRQRSAPAGYDVTLGVPQSQNAAGLATAHLDQAVVTLPEGTVVSPSAASGLQACAPAEIALDSTDDPSCPDASKIGAVVVDTPLLEEPLTGNIYLAAQGNNPFNSLLAIYLVARGPGVIIKLAGRVEPDPVTGRLTAVFDDNPQLPFSKFTLRFKTGPRAPLSNPMTCGVKSTVTRLTSWGGQVATPGDQFTVTSDGSSRPCGTSTFAPSFEAGTTDAAAGADTAFTLTFSRTDDDQTLGDITLDMPQGLLAAIAKLPVLCSDVRAAAGTCDDGSKIGSVTTAAGPGSQPFYLPGTVYMTGPYKGAPFGLSIVVPARAGPFDLGTVVVRAAVFVDRSTAALRIVADPLPSILQGIPLQVRLVNVAVDRPEFMLNPTNCASTRVAGSIRSTQGSTAAVASRFQVGGCASLPYAPRLGFSIGNRRHVRASATTPLAVTLRMPEGQANNRSVAVTLPQNVNSRLAGLRGACSVEDARARRCGREAIVGSAVAVTPLLRDPLRGPVYIIRTPGNRLPNLWVALKSAGREAGIDIDLIGRVRIVGKKLLLRTTFGEVPDVPVSMFRLKFVAGRQAPIGIIRGICSARVRRAMVAKLTLIAQSGRRIDRDQRMHVSGCRTGKRSAKQQAKDRKRTKARARRAARRAAAQVQADAKRVAADRR